MKEISFKDIDNEEWRKDAIQHTHEPFIKDYLALHLLLKGYNIKSVMEIGTHIGEGTNIICNAVPGAKVYSLDLSEDQSHKTLQHPKLKDMKVGELCERPFIQLWGDSMTFKFLKYPCEAWYIDGEHTYSNVRRETKEAIKQKAKLIIWHDADMQEVNNAINDSFEWNKDYELYRITDTRIAYAIHL